MLYSRRKRLSEDQLAAAAGRDLWTDRLPPEARFKLAYAVRDFVDQCFGSYGTWDHIAEARKMVLRDLGLPKLTSSNDESADFFDSLLQSAEDTVYSQLEAVLVLAKVIAESTSVAWGYSYESATNVRRRLPGLQDTISTTLREHWIKCDLVDGKFIDIESRQLHESVVIPSLTLLGANKRFVQAEKAFQDALREIHNGSPEDAITDAATALQEALGALGMTGNTVSKRVDEAIKGGLLMPYDRKLGEWLEADRSTKGDAHNAAPADAGDAWLAVHIVGAVIVRVASGPTRSSPR